MHTPAEIWAERAPMIVVTGEIGAGKTTWCLDLVAHVRSLGLHVAGLSSPGVFVDAEKVAIDLLDLSTYERRRLADRRSAADLASPTPNWYFHVEALAWGDDVLNSISGCDLLVIDELGPLELRHNRGWRSALPLLKRGCCRAACVVVRRSLLAEFLAIFPNAFVVEIERASA